MNEPVAALTDPMHRTGVNLYSKHWLQFRLLCDLVDFKGEKSFLQLTMLI
jgi:hypothetical protein